MVLHHVANGADLFVELTATLHAKVLGHRDLHARDMVPIPDRFEKGVGKPEIEQVLDRLLAQVMIDAEDGRFGEALVQRTVERLRGREVAAKGLFDDHPRIPGAAGLGQPLDDGPEHARRDRKVVQWPRGATERPAQAFIRLGRGIVTVNVLKPRRELRESARIDAAVLVQAVARTRQELIEGPVRPGNADDWQVEVTAANHRLQRREDLLVRQISRSTEEHQGVGMRCRHRHPGSLSAVFST